MGYMHYPEKFCYLVYFNRGNTTIPVGVFSTEEKAREYCEKNPMIQFCYTKIEKIALDDMECDRALSDILRIDNIGKPSQNKAENKAKDVER